MTTIAFLSPGNTMSESREAEGQDGTQEPIRRSLKARSCNLTCSWPVQGGEGGDGQKGGVCLHKNWRPPPPRKQRNREGPGALLAQPIKGKERDVERDGLGKEGEEGHRE